MIKSMLFQTTPRILMGPGALARTGAEVRRLGARKALIVTDPGVVAAGLATRLEAVLKEPGSPGRASTRSSPTRASRSRSRRPRRPGPSRPTS